MSLFAVELHLGSCFVALVRLLDVFGAQLGASWAPLGANLERLGRLLELLGASWSQLGGSWAPLGANLEALGRLLEPLGHLLGSTWVPWPPLGPNLEPFGSLRDSTWPFQLTSKCNLDSTWRFKLDSTRSNSTSLSTSVLQLSSCSCSYYQQGSCCISCVLTKGLPSSTILRL